METIDTVALMAAMIAAQQPEDNYNPDAIAREAWRLYEAVQREHVRRRDAARQEADFKTGVMVTR